MNTKSRGFFFVYKANSFKNPRMLEENWTDIWEDTLITTAIEMTEAFLIKANPNQLIRKYQFLSFRGLKSLQFIGIYSIFSLIRDSLDFIAEIRDYYIQEKTETSILNSANPYREGFGLFLSWSVPYAFDYFQLIKPMLLLALFDALLGVLTYYLTIFLWNYTISLFHNHFISNEDVWHNNSVFPYVKSDDSDLD